MFFKNFISVFDDQEKIRAHVKEEMETRKMALQDMKKREKNHEIVKEDKKCDKCDITFPTMEGLSYHKMTQTYAEGTKYRCPVCSIESCHYYGIKTHIENVHNNKEKVKNLKFEANPTASGATLYTAKNFSGTKIQIGGETKNDSMETKTGDENVNKLKAATIQNSSIDKGEDKKVEKENFKCDMCQNSFNNIQALNYHKAKNVKFRCPHCQFMSCTL